MPTGAREQRLARRISDLHDTDPQFAAACPSAEVAEVLRSPALRLPHIIHTVMDGYADRPAVAQRAIRFVADPKSGRTSPDLLPHFETLSYRQLSARVDTVAAALTRDPVRPGDRVVIVGFPSIEYTTLDLALLRTGSIAVPVQAGQLRTAVAETEPVCVASTVELLGEAVDVVLAGHAPARLIVFDYHEEVDDQREAVSAATARLAARPVIVETLPDVMVRGRALPAAPVFDSGDDDTLALLIYTSGSTGSPKGAMIPERLVANQWRRSSLASVTSPANPAIASITLNFMPMSHMAGRNGLYDTLGAGGTAYFVAKSDLSTLLEDLSLARPTQLTFVPRIWDMMHTEFLSEVDRRISVAGNRAAVQAEVMAELRQRLLGGRVLMAVTGSAPTSPELKAFAEALLDMHVIEHYGSTESGVVFIDGQVQRPPVSDYKLVDVADLSYFRTDLPHPRGELLVKSSALFAGYYKRPEVTAEMFDEDGYYRTGDIFAETGTDQLVYLDRRNNVLKLSQGEFVTPSRLEAVFGDSPQLRQIYVYGNSARAFLLAVVVPTEQALANHDFTELKSVIGESIQDIAKATGLQSYEVPRDFIIETKPFTPENGLLASTHKMVYPKLRERYGERLERLYVELADGQADELQALRQCGADAPVLTTVSRAAGALLGSAAVDLQPDARFSDLGGDSLSALTFSNLLHEVFDIEVPVGVIVSPTTDLQALADYVEAARRREAERPTFASVHGPGSTEIRARDLSLDKFVDAQTLAAASSLPGPSSEVRTVLLTGATGFLGRYLALEWLERMKDVGGKLICLVRGKDDGAARDRLDKTFDSGDPGLLKHYQRLAAEHLEVIAGDKGEANLGLDQQTWQRLADCVDLIVDPAALVNHVLPYSQLFGPNVLGTGELIRLALTAKKKPFTYVSTVGVGVGTTPGEFTEDADIRVISATRKLDNTYANGYGNSKWAGEVLLREAHDQCGLPVSVFRCGMILADTTYVGQLNLPDVFTRMMLSLVASGVAPDSFYELDHDGNRQRAHFDGLPVEFIAEAIAALGERIVEGFETYHVMNPHDDGIGLDEYVDWLTDAGYPTARVDDYQTWLSRFETAIRALPAQQRQASILPLLHNYRRPEKPICGSTAPTDRFRKAVQEAKLETCDDIPRVTREVIVKYITDLQLLGLV